MTAVSEAERSTTSERRPPRIFATLLFLLGLPMTAGGLTLITLGGSAYYLIAGLVIIASAALIWRGRRSGAWLYAVFIAGTLIWSLWEVGLDAWALMPRLLLPVALGAWLLMPWVRRRLA